MISNSKFTNICFHPSAQGLIVKTTLKSDLPCNPGPPFLANLLFEDTLVE